ncbi:hypothetical protein HDU67_007056 [Dinochytrium kinnereticum]|nr:hypothetical protein HDU67_007056 [Dinochytrium kinnereticum]
MAGVPPPPSPPSTPSAASSQPTPPFETVLVDEKIQYKFPVEASLPPSTIPLRTVVKAFAPGVMMGKTISADQLYLSLGKLRSSQHALKEYNASVGVVRDAPNHNLSALDGVSRLSRHHAMDLFSVLGFQVQSPTDTVTVNGLDDLIDSVEELFKETIDMHRSQIQGGMVSFEGLGELFRVGSIVSGATALGSGSVRAGYLITSAFYEEKRTLFGKEQCFRMEMESIVAFGRYFSTVRFEEIFSGWQGSRMKAVFELPYFPADSAAIAAFTARGDKCVDMVGGGGDGADCRFVQYRSGAFYPHQQQRRSQVVASSSTGRIVIDGERGLALGHYPSQGSDEVTLAMMQAASRYKRALGESAFGKGPAGPPPNVETLLLFSDVPKSLRSLLWPSLVGFSFTTKGWGHVLVESLEEIEFNDRAFDLLVLTPERKRLIKALVSFGGKSTQAKFQDIVSGKAGGSVFLLHGPPGVGKTLTAEAIAELLHRPLYYVTMGELGTNPEEMEKRLGAVLELCAGWDALAIIDEADVFLEKRASGSASDVVRNAMVCVMLRLIEYHQGILFLTTNRILVFDPAFESRVTVALKYDHLTPDAREKVWRNLIANLSGVEVASIDYAKLAETVMNGRQIKNSVRLALALAEDASSPLTQELIEETMAITALGRLEMETSAAY